MNGSEIGLKVFGILVVVIGSAVTFSATGKTSSKKKKTEIQTWHLKFPVKQEPLTYWQKLLRVKQPDPLYAELKWTSKKTETSSEEDSLTGDIEVELKKTGKLANEAVRGVITTFEEWGKKGEGECESPDGSSEDSSEDSTDQFDLQEITESICKAIFIRYSDDMEIVLAPTVPEALNSLYAIGYNYSEGFLILFGLYRSRIISIHFGWGGFHLILVNTSINEDGFDDVKEDNTNE